MTLSPCSPQSHPRRLLLPCVLVLTLSTAIVSAHAQDATLSSRIRGQVQPFVEQKEISGAVTLVGSAERVLSLEAVGRRNLEDDLPMRPDTLFRIASMTKPITAIGIMMLADAGRL